MKDGETEHAADELEVVQVLGVDRRVRVDLERVVVVLQCASSQEGFPWPRDQTTHSRVLEQTVERVEHLVRQEEEEFPRCHVSVTRAHEQ